MQGPSPPHKQNSSREEGLEYRLVPQSGEIFVKALEVHPEKSARSADSWRPFKV